MIHSRQSSPRLTPDMRRALETGIPENLEEYHPQEEELDQEE